MKPPSRLAMAFVILSSVACAPQSARSSADSSPASIQQDRFDRIVYAGDSSRVLYRVTDKVSGFPDLTRLVIRDSATWRGVWARLVASDARRAPPPVPTPSVDFAREIVLLAAQGPAFCASGISIDTVYRIERSVIGVAIVRSYEALGGCGCLAYSRAPAVAIRLSLDEVEVIRFVERPPRDNCRRSTR